LVTDCHSILARWRNYFSQLLDVHGVNDVRQTETHTAESLVPECLSRRLWVWDGYWNAKKTQITNYWSNSM